MEITIPGANGGPDTRIICAYRAPNSGLGTFDVIDKRVAEAERTKAALLIIGDLNVPGFDLARQTGSIWARTARPPP